MASKPFCAPVPAMAFATLDFCSSFMLAVASRSSSMTSARARALPLLSKNWMPRPCNVSRAWPVFVDRRVIIMFSDVPAIDALMPLFAIRPVIRATS